MQKKSGLAVRLKALRREKGVTSQVVADAIGIKSATYRRYEIDTKPRDEVYVALADIVCVPLPSVTFVLLPYVSYVKFDTTPSGLVLVSTL